MLINVGLIAIIIILTAIISVLIIQNKFYKLSVDRLGLYYFRFETYYKIISLWLLNKNKGKTIGGYLAAKGISSIAIYGAGKLGEILYYELKEDPKVEIGYIIDQGSYNNKFDNLTIKKIEEIKSMPKVDVIVVTPIYAYESIKESLNKIGVDNLMAIDDIVYEMSGLGGNMF